MRRVGVLSNSVIPKIGRQGGIAHHKMLSVGGLHNVAYQVFG